MKRPIRLRRIASTFAFGAGVCLARSACGCGDGDGGLARTHAWMSACIVAEQGAAPTDAAKEAVANRRAKLLLPAMSLAQKEQQLTGSAPGILPELPRCFGARHVVGIAALDIPTLRITNGPVGLGQNDCVSSSVEDAVAAGTRSPFDAISDAGSAHATALPSAIGVAASFDPAVAAAYGDLIGTEMNNLALHVFEAPGMNLARLPILGRNFEYFGEDPFLAGTMAVVEIRAVQAKGIIAMAKHFVANEQETNRTTIRETIDRQVLRELYLLPFEMAVRDARTAAVMCSYNAVNGASACENGELLTDVLRTEWGFSGYVQSDFAAMKSTARSMQAGTDHEMPVAAFWTPAALDDAIAAGTLTTARLDEALERRYTRMFEAGIFDRPLAQTPIDFVAGARIARDLGARSAVLLQNNGALPLPPGIAKVVVVGKASQVYAQQAVAGGAALGQPMGSGGGSSDVVPDDTVAPIDGIRNTLRALGNASATVELVLVSDDNTTATVDGRTGPFAMALARMAAADAVVVMAGTVAEEGADRAAFTSSAGTALAGRAADGSSLDWYAAKSNTIATDSAAVNAARNSNTVAMIEAVMAVTSTTAKAMPRKTALVSKDNAGVSMDPSLVGSGGPAILEVWFPGQEDGDIVADLLFGQRVPSGKLPVTFPYAGRGFLDSVTAQQFPGLLADDGVTPSVAYSEMLNIGYRWYDANIGGLCRVTSGTNPCVAFPFGHGLSYTTFTIASPTIAANAGRYDVEATVTNTGPVAASEVVQVYLSLPGSADTVGAVQPPKRLVGFRKVELAPGASRQVSIPVDPAARHHPLSVWSTATGKWITAAGRYTVYVGNSSSPKDLAQAGTFTR